MNPCNPFFGGCPFPDPDILYHRAEEDAKQAHEYYRENRFDDAVYSMEQALRLIRLYKDNIRSLCDDGHLIGLDLEIAVYDIDLNFFRANKYLHDDCYFMGQREAQIGFNKVLALRKTYVGKRELLDRRTAQLYDLLNYAHDGCEDTTNPPFVDLLNKRDIAILMERYEKVDAISRELAKLRGNNENSL